MGELTVVIVAFATLLLGVIQYLYQLAKTNNKNTMAKNAEILKVEKEKLELNAELIKKEIEINELNQDLSEAREVAKKYYKLYQDASAPDIKKDEN